MFLASPGDVKEASEEEVECYEADIYIPSTFAALCRNKKSAMLNKHLFSKNLFS